jgi:hypothetical protein
MYQDEIIAEVWKNRDSYTAKHHHNLAEIVADLQARQKRVGCRIVDRRDRRRLFERPSSSINAEA